MVTGPSQVTRISLPTSMLGAPIAMDAPMAGSVMGMLVAPGMVELGRMAVAEVENCSLLSEKTTFIVSPMAVLAGRPRLAVCGHSD